MSRKKSAAVSPLNWKAVDWSKGPTAIARELGVKYFHVTNARRIFGPGSPERHLQLSSRYTLGRMLLACLDGADPKVAHHAPEDLQLLAEAAQRLQAACLEAAGKANS